MNDCSPQQNNHVLSYMLETLEKFRDDRNWSQFHSIKDMAMALNSESQEVLDLMLWKSEDEMTHLIKTSQESNQENNFTQDFQDEIIDTINWALLLFAKSLGESDTISKDVFCEKLLTAFKRKVAENNKKYPVEKCYGKKEKYPTYQMDL